MKSHPTLIPILITIHDESAIPSLKLSVKGFNLKDRFLVATGRCSQWTIDNLKKDNRITVELSQVKSTTD